MHFPSFSQSVLLLKIRIFSQAPGKILELTHIPSVRRKDVGKMFPLAIRSSRAAGGGPATNPARARRSPTGEEQREGLGTTKDPFVAKERGEAARASLVGRRRAAPTATASRPASTAAKHGG
jgi:hypothetical protein